MIKRDIAVKIQESTLDAIRTLSVIVNIGHEGIDPEIFSPMKRCIGIAIGELDEKILTVIYDQYPELNDLR